jgi:hypothetical protein
LLQATLLQIQRGSFAWILHVAAPRTLRGLTSGLRSLAKIRFSAWAGPMFTSSSIFASCLVRGLPAPFSHREYVMRDSQQGRPLRLGGSQCTPHLRQQLRRENEILSAAPVDGFLPVRLHACRLEGPKTHEPHGIALLDGGLDGVDQRFQNALDAALDRSFLEARISTSSARFMDAHM